MSSLNLSSRTALGNGIKIKLKIAACRSLHISDHGNESFFFYRTKEEGGGDRSVLNRGNSVGDLASWRRFSSLFRSLLRFTSVPHGSRSANSGNIAASLRHEIAKSSSTLALSPSPLYTSVIISSRV